MGPRSGDRGNRLAAQCGGQAVSMLQWGRDLVIAEMKDPGLAGRKRNRMRFNGAAIW